MKYEAAWKCVSAGHCDKDTPVQSRTGLSVALAARPGLLLMDKGS